MTATTHDATGASRAGTSSPRRRRWRSPVHVAVSTSRCRRRSGARYDNLLVLVELKGGNDGFNTLVPYADAGYFRLRPKLAVARDTVIKLDDRVGLHPVLAPLLPVWEKKELAVLQGVGYPDPNLSHFRSIEIWDTASRSHEYLQSGWLARTFGAVPTPTTFAADGVVIGSNDMGPLAGGGTRALALADTDRFVDRARLAHIATAQGNAALMHVLKTEGDIVAAASRLARHRTFTTTFPKTPFGDALRTASEIVGNTDSIAAVRVTLNGFDTHRGQAAIQTRLLQDLATDSSRCDRRSAKSTAGATRSCSPMPNSDAGLRRTCRSAPTTAPRACISRWGAASPAGCTARRPRWRGSPATTTSRMRSIFARSMRRRSRSGGASTRPRSSASVSPALPYLRA